VHNPEDHNMNLQCRGNVKSYTDSIYFVLSAYLWGYVGSRNSGFSKITEYGWAIRVRFLEGADVSFHYHVQTGSGNHPASNPMAIGGSAPSVGPYLHLNFVIMKHRRL
jgi:hypothetical protein